MSEEIRTYVANIDFKCKSKFWCSTRLRGQQPSCDANNIDDKTFTMSNTV
ncbi:MAG: hypothetical protein P1U35_11780 [Cycloclasticus sp.]|nr:hypothetical protein [Cycloclasticus sp.]